MEYFTEFPDAGDTLFKAMSSEDGNVDLSFLKGDRYIFCYADGFNRAGDAAVVEAEVHVAVGCIVLSEDVHRAENLDAGGIHGDQDLRLA